MRNWLSFTHIKGYGIEVGGLHFPLPVAPGVKVTYVDRMSLEELKRTADVVPVENNIVVDDAEKLDKFENDSLDFIIANHVFEHCRSPLTTLQVWHKRLKPGGILYAAIPEKTYTFDRERSVTTLQHILNDCLIAPYTDDEAHYREWYSIVDKHHGEALEEKVRQCVADKTNIHFHVWDLAAMREMFYSFFNPFEVLDVGNNGAEIIWVMRKK